MLVTNRAMDSELLNPGGLMPNRLTLVCRPRDQKFLDRLERQLFLGPYESIVDKYWCVEGRRQSC